MSKEFEPYILSIKICPQLEQACRRRVLLLDPIEGDLPCRV